MANVSATSSTFTAPRSSIKLAIEKRAGTPWRATAPSRVAAEMGRFFAARVMRRSIARYHGQYVGDDGDLHDAAGYPLGRTTAGHNNRCLHAKRWKKGR